MSPKRVLGVDLPDDPAPPRPPAEPPPARAPVVEAEPPPTRRSWRASSSSGPAAVVRELGGYTGVIAIIVALGAIFKPAGEAPPPADYGKLQQRVTELEAKQAADRALCLEHFETQAIRDELQNGWICRQNGGRWARGVDCDADFDGPLTPHPDGKPRWYARESWPSMPRP